MKHAVRLSTVFFVILLAACNSQAKKTQETETISSEPVNKGKELVEESVKIIGDYKKLRSKKDVVYTYTYSAPDGRRNISTEKYIFDGELSYGYYHEDERSFPTLGGQFEQSYDGRNYYLKHKDELITDSTMLKRVAFSRPTNFYWFAMFQKLLDPGLTYEYLGERTLEENKYDIVKVGFTSDAKPQDIYQLYINQESKLIDQFLFTVAEQGVTDTPLLMVVEYTEIEGLLIPSKRKYRLSNWDAEIISTVPWIDVLWSDISFNNGLSPEDFTLE